MIRELKLLPGRKGHYYVYDISNKKIYDAVIYCDRYKCIFSQEIMDKLGCNIFVRAHFADMLIYDINTKSIDLRNIRELCKRFENGLRCISIDAPGLKRSGIYVCIYDVIRLLMNAIKPKPLEAVLRQIEWGLPLALSQIKGLTNRDREELQLLVYEIIVDKIIPWLKSKGLIESI